MPKILVFNAGSTSLKYKIFDLGSDQPIELKSGEVSGIGSADGPKNHKLALSLLFEGYGITAPNLGKIKDLIAIAHRVVYGGSVFREPVLISKSVIVDLKKYNQLAPLHNPPIIDVIELVLENTGRKGHRNIPSYAVFDTAFYKDLPDVSKIYPLPYYLYQEEQIQRFGFHGLSHQHVTEVIKDKFPDKKKIISVHLGAGSSISVILNGKAIDTTMGFTPQEGLMMSTRSGDIDPGIITYLLRKEKLSVKEVVDIITNQSGLLGISGVSSSMKDILYTAGYEVEDLDYKPDSKIKLLPDIYKVRAKLAIKIFIYRIKKYIGAFYGILGGIDVLAFTGKIGAGSSVIRNMITKDLNHILLNSKIIVVPTDEELQIAKEIAKIL